jgi:hypothetical protein
MRAQWHAGRFLRVLSVPLVLAGGLVVAVPSVSAATCQNWTGVPPPSPGNGGNVLDGVALVSACDAWAVGFSSGGNSDQTLIEHWDGAAWTVVPAPSPGTSFSTLTSVRAVSATNAWAVGSFSNGTGDQTLILHWNGTDWQQVPSPNQGGTAAANSLTGVAATSLTNAWAVGRSATGVVHTALILHWDGTKWAHVPGPHPGTTSDLFAVAAAAASNAWAVGTFTGSGPTQALALHCC